MTSRTHSELIAARHYQIDLALNKKERKKERKEIKRNVYKREWRCAMWIFGLFFPSFDI